MSEAKSYAEFGIPDAGAVPVLVRGVPRRFRRRARPRGGSFTAPAPSAGPSGPTGESVSVGMNWTERFADGAWQPLRDKDVVVFLQAGAQYIAIEATERNMAGLAAIARLISPEVDDRARSSPG